MTQQKDPKTDSKTDFVSRRVDVYKLRRLIIANGWTMEDLCKKSKISKGTARRLFANGRTRTATIKTVAAALGVSQIDLIEASQYERPREPGDSQQPNGSASEWLIGGPLGKVQTAANGLQYRLFRMQHRHQSTRFGRGKRYEFAALADGAQQQLKDRFVRHTEVCDRIGRHPQFPICYATYPDSERWVWWVIDEWVEGKPLTGRFVKEPIPLPIAARWACELARGLAALHAVGIVRRELSPENVLVREADDSLVLTDFELAKLAGNLPTVSAEWPDDPYRAAEVGVGEATAAADLYSWACIVTKIVTGELPRRGTQNRLLIKRLPKRVFDVVAACCEQRSSRRLQSCDEVLPIVEQWSAELNGAAND